MDVGVYVKKSIPNVKVFMKSNVLFFMVTNLRIFPEYGYLIIINKSHEPSKSFIKVNYFIPAF